MNGLALDCSAIFGFVFEDEQTPYAMAVAEALKEKQGFVPSLFYFEAGNVLHSQEKRRRWERSQTERFFETIAALPLVIEDFHFPRQSALLLSLARRHGLSVYDAAYLAVALQHRIPLATEDKLLKRAAQKERFYFDP